MKGYLKFKRHVSEYCLFDVGMLTYNRKLV